MRVSLGLVCVLMAAACGDNVDAPDDNEGEAKQDPGGLVTVKMESRVGVLLDEIPLAMRDRVAQRLLAKPTAFWIQRARNQIKLTSYRLVFRQYFYGGGASGKQQLPLPPEEVQTVVLKNSPRRAMVNGHDYVLVDYKMNGVLVTTATSPKDADPALGRIGGKVIEPFEFPVDPELLFQRTRYDCADEAEFPPNSVDSEEMESFYDQECGIEGSLGNLQCHQTELVQRSCIQSLDAFVGRHSTSIEFVRVAWNDTLAAQNRFGTITNTNGADLQLIEEEFRTHRVVYRYIPQSSCTLVEQCVGGPGWRRLLQFSTSDKNTGTKTLDIGPVDYYLSGQNGYLSEWGLFEFSACHQHYHFSHYGDFTYGPEIERKNGFCLQSTARVMNHEFGPLTNPYGACEYQGVEASWADQYKAGLECQWVDVTTVDTSAHEVTHPLSFTSNPDGFLCEGTPILDSHGDPVFEPTEFKTATGETVYRAACDEFPGWDTNNGHSYNATLPISGSSYVTQGCDRGQIGPLRNCGFEDNLQTFDCTPGTQVTMTCDLQGNTAQPQVARLCEFSKVLGVGTACTAQDAMASAAISKGGTSFKFRCPTARDSQETGGKVSLYTAPVFPDDAAARMTCTVQ